MYQVVFLRHFKWCFCGKDRLLDKTMEGKFRATSTILFLPVLTTLVKFPVSIPPVGGITVG